MGSTPLSAFLADTTPLAPSPPSYHATATAHAATARVAADCARVMEAMADLGVIGTAQWSMDRLAPATAAAHPRDAPVAQVGGFLRMEPARCAWTPCTVPTALCSVRLAPCRATAATERQAMACVYAQPDFGEPYATSNVSVSTAPISAMDMVPVANMPVPAAVSQAPATGFGPVQHVPSAIHFMSLPTARCDAQRTVAAHHAVAAPIVTAVDAAPVSKTMKTPKKLPVVQPVNRRAQPAYPSARLAFGERTAINFALEQLSLCRAMHAPEEASVPP